MAIRVLNRFAGANVRVLALRQAPEAEVVFAADPHGGPEALWFYFRIEDPDRPATPSESLTLTLRFSGNAPEGADPLYCRPVMREPGKSWSRLRAPDISHSEDGQPLLRWTIPYPAARVELAFSHPYGRDELDVLLQRGKNFWREEAVGLTQDGHVITRLDNRISGRGKGTAAPRGLFLLARQQAGAAPGSWVIDGMLETFSRARPANWCIWAIPFANLDGVIGGDYGMSSFPFDLNRAWSTPPMRHEAAVMQHAMRLWATHCTPELVLDLGASGPGDHDGINARISPLTPETQRPLQTWANVLQQALEPEFPATPFVRPSDDTPLPTVQCLPEYVQKRFGCCALAIETPYAICRDTPMTPKQYREVGRRLAQAILSRW